MNKRIRSFGFAGNGIFQVFKSEPNMKIHIVLAVLVIIAGFVFSISLMEWILCLLCFGMVIGAEMINTAIEDIVDLVSPDHHPLAGRAKDVAAGAVLVCAFVSAIIGLIIFVPKGWSLFLNYL